MKHYNYILPALLLLIFTESCKKSAVVKPANNLNSKTTTTKTSAPSAPIDTDALIHSISFTAPPQYVIATVADSVLTLSYNENINLFIPKQGYDLSWAVHLTESFTNSILSKFAYTTVDAGGNTDTDWIDDNLNNITAKTVSDTTINGMAMVKINIQRPFTFTKTYENNATAVGAQNTILVSHTDEITFSSYVFFTQTYPATATSLSVTYLKGN